MYSLKYTIHTNLTSQLGSAKTETNHFMFKQIKILQSYLIQKLFNNLLQFLVDSSLKKKKILVAT